MTLERHDVPTPGGTLALALHLPSGRERVPCVVACHGLQASKDSEKYLLLGAEFSRAGLALGRFDFRGCGASPGVLEDTTVGTRLEDLRAIVAFLAGHPRLDGRLGLLGSSMGGFVVLHFARERADAPPVVTWNAPANLSDLAHGDRGDIPGVGVAFAMEYMRGTYALSPPNVPRHLVVHGEADEVVPLDHGVTLHSRAAEPCDLAVIAGGDHRLTDRAHRWRALQLSLEWFLRFLS